MTSFAKPDQLYEEHISWTYDSWKDIVDAKSSIIKRLGKEFGFSEDRFLKSSLMTVVTHDIGKNITVFQNIMEKKRRKEKVNYKENYRHEVASFPFAIRASLALTLEEPLYGNFPLDAIAVLSSHKDINIGLDSFLREIHSRPTYNKEGVIDALKIANVIFKKEGFTFPKIPVYDYNPCSDISNLLGYGGAFTKLYIKNNNFLAIRTIYSLLKAILNYADWYGSSGEKINYSLKNIPEDVVKGIKERCFFKKINYNGLTNFQEECGKTLGNVIAISPTGTGKTEASLLWGLNNLNGGKLIYLLPTMVTANSIFNRTERYFGKGNVGLTHSTASFTLYDEEGDPKIRKDALFDKSFIRPATVATIDQLLATGFNTGRWSIIESNAVNSTIIIDEIHSYDYWTLGLIVSTIKHLSFLGAKFMLMSATFPNFLSKLLKKILPDIKIIKDNTLQNSYRNRYKVIDRPIESAIPDIEKSVNDDKKTIIVVNDVAKCQLLFEELRYLNPICYHSKFTYMDKINKEILIEKESPLLIATQILEVSLDIDYDNMFTECASPDALIQRFGRNNRYGLKKDTCVNIYRPSEISRKIYDRDNSGILENTFDIFQKSGEYLTEKDLIKIVNDVYANINIEDKKEFIDSTILYTRVQNRLLGIFDNPDINEKETRKERYFQIPVIPSIFKEKVLSLLPSQRRLYELKMPYWYVVKNKERIENITFCNMKYDNEIGAQRIDR